MSDTQVELPKNDLVVLEQREARARQVFADSRSPIEVINEHYNNIIEDNLQLINERKADLMELEVLNDLLARERKKNDELTQKYLTAAGMLSSITADAETVSDTLVKMFKKARSVTDTDKVSDVVKEYAPKTASEAALRALSPANLLAPADDPWKGNN